MNNKKYINILIFICLLVFVGMFELWPKKSYNNASLLWKQGHYQQAIDIWKQQLRISKNENSDVYQNLIGSLIYIGKFNDAEKWCLKALTIFPQYVIFKFYISLIEFYKGRYKKSLTLSESVLKQDNTYPNIHLLRGLDFKKLGNRNKAKKEFIEEINDNPSNTFAWVELKIFKK
jgi:tetratricopeptide (TPR) repeat protein